MNAPEEVYIGYWEGKGLTLAVPGPVMNQDRLQMLFRAWIDAGANEIKRAGRAEYLNMLKTLEQGGMP